MQTWLILWLFPCCYDQFHASYSVGSVSESNLLVDENLSVQAWQPSQQLPFGSGSESDSVDKSLGVQTW